MEVRVTLNENDYWAFSNRILSSGLAKQIPKWKSRSIMLGIGIVIGIFSAFLWRKYSNGETSLMEVFGPTLAALFSIAILMQVYSVVYRQRITPIEGGFVLGPKSYMFRESGYTESSEFHKTEINWKVVETVISDPEHIFIMLDRCAGHIIPKRAFETAEAAESFVSQLTKYLKTSNLSDS